jgi:hypothetical protein
MMGNTMTAARRQRKLHTHVPGKTGFGTGPWLAVLVAAGLSLAGQSGAATTERVVVDHNSGLAISGFDPVAYFTDAKALPGKGEFEQAVEGAVWRFRSFGNRAAFKADPTVYMPRFGGYDPVGVVRGVAVPGNPRLWVISGERLYLFYSEQTQAEFADDSDHTVAAADRVWPSIRLKLVP